MIINNKIFPLLKKTKIVKLLILFLILLTAWYILFPFSRNLNDKEDLVRSISDKSKMLDDISSCQKLNPLLYKDNKYNCIRVDSKTCRLFFFSLDELININKKIELAIKECIKIENQML